MDIKFGWRTALLLALGVMLSGASRELRAQSILTDALAWLPPQTVAFEYSRTSDLRSLPDYASLRAHYLGRNLRALEESLAKLGIQEGDINEMVLGWQVVAGTKMQYEGIATGQFDEQSMSQQAAVARISPETVEGVKAYCFPSDPNRTCVAVVDNALGVFGPLNNLDAMLKARAGSGPSIASNTKFTERASYCRIHSALW